MPGSPTNYNELQASVLAWLDDASLTARVPEMIGFAESRLSRRLNRPEMEATGTITASNGTAVLPSDLMALRSVYTGGSPRYPLNVVSEADFHDSYGLDSGQPSRYAVVGGNILIGPTTSPSYTIQVSYKQTLPALSVAMPTNWLLAIAPDLYLFHAVLEAEAYGWNDTRLPWLKAHVDELIDEVNKAGTEKRYGLGPIVMRSPVRGWR